MSHWPCSIEDCEAPALIYNGDCDWCGEHYCAEHVEDENHHTCHLKTVDERWDVREALFKKAESTAHSEFERYLPQILRGADEFVNAKGGSAKCTVVRKPDGSQPVTLAGTSNTNFVLQSSDGQQVLCRLRQRNARTPSIEAARAAMLSEAVTCRLLHQAGLPVPHASFTTLQIQSPSASDDMPLYYLMQSAPGTMHSAFENPDETPVSESTIKAIERIAEWYIALADRSSLQFGSVGSPCPAGESELAIGPIVEEFPSLSSPPFYLGPFSSPHARYYTYYDTIMRQILRGQRCVPSRALEEYLVALEMRTLVDACSELQDAGPYYLKQGEDRGDHILFNESGDIGGVIDWEWTTTTCKADAFCAPVACLNWDFFDGNNSLCPREVVLIEAYRRLGRDDLAGYVKQGKKFQRLRSQLLEKGIPDVRVLNATRRAFLEQEDGIDGEPQSPEEWIKVALARYRDDPGVKVLKERAAALLRGRPDADGRA